MAGETLPALVACSYGSSQTLDETSGTCYTDDSIVRNKTAVIAAKNKATGGTGGIEEWKATSADWNPTYKLNFCSVAQISKLSGSSSCQDLATMKVFK